MSPSAKFPATLLATAVLALAAGAADARTSDRNQPMDIEAAHQVCGLGANDSCTYTDVTERKAAEEYQMDECGFKLGTVHGLVRNMANANIWSNAPAGALGPTNIGVMCGLASLATI